MVNSAEARNGFVLLPKRWVAERSFRWLASFRRLSRDIVRMSEVFACLHFVVFNLIMRPKIAMIGLGLGGNS